MKIFHFIFLFLISDFLSSIDVFFVNYYNNQTQTGLESTPYQDLNIGLNLSLDGNLTLDLYLGNNVDDYNLRGFYDFNGLNIVFRYLYARIENCFLNYYLDLILP